MKQFYLLILITLFSCEDLHKSEMKKELGVVVAKQYNPEVNETATGVGISTGGNAVITTHNIHVKERYNVVFKCEHGIVFTINSKDVFSKVYERDSVVIDYYEILNEENIIRDLDFIDANILTTPIKSR